jgi:prepilin-type processing-associated H-X9-DG protein
LAEVTDGTSQTLILAEDTAWPDGQWINGRNIFDQAFAINAAPAFENDIRSDHPGGANGLLVDGAVRFLAESTDLDVLAAICTRAGGEPVAAF